jgi:cytochrome c1
VSARRPVATRCFLPLLALLLLPAAACRPDAGDSVAHEAMLLTAGDPARGPALMRKYGCQTCHTIPGVSGANGLVGPPLTAMASRSYVAGVLPNSPANLMRWIRDPKGVDSLTAMPNTGVTASDVRHIAAYLYTLR